jgi:hypothetical protein
MVDWIDYGLIDIMELVDQLHFIADIVSSRQGLNA